MAKACDGQGAAGLAKILQLCCARCPAPTRQAGHPGSRPRGVLCRAEHRTPIPYPIPVAGGGSPLLWGPARSWWLRGWEAQLRARPCPGGCQQLWVMAGAVQGSLRVLVPCCGWESLHLALVPWGGQGDGQRVYGEGISEPGVMGQGRAAPPGRAAPFWCRGRRRGCGSGGCVVMGTVPAIPAGNRSPAGPPLHRVGKGSKKGEICGVGAVLDLQGPTGRPMQT